MYTLYYSPAACSMAVHVMLNEIGAKYELRKASENGTKTADMLRVNPRGSVPVLVDDGHVIREGGAIIVYLLDKEKSPLLPRDGFARASALEWLMFCNATLHPQYSRLFGAGRLEDEALKSGIAELATTQINAYWQELEEHLAQSRYLVGEQLTAADILLTVIANWSAHFPKIVIGPNAKRLFAEVIARPSYRQALASENVQYKVAA